MLKKTVFTPFNARELKPTGWLKEQLTLQMEGLSGNLDKVWPDIRESKWIGGDKDGWERVPYWLDGFIPLVWILDHEDGKARAKKYVDAIIAGQQPDGWICPCTDKERNSYDMWALFLLCKVLTVYADCSGDDRIEEVVYRALKQFMRHLECNTLMNWGSARWFECLIPLFWLYERRPEDWMLQLARNLQNNGIDYERIFADWHFEKPYEKGRWTYLTHVVNLGMMLKCSALMSRLTGKDPSAFAQEAWDTLLRDHGMAAGHFTGDECLAGFSPIQGSECCSVVEAMYSFECLLSITGESRWGDLLETEAFNLLPATISPDMWSHQYDQMSNQIQCSRVPDELVPFRTNSGESHLFGLEPNFGCCTANFNQGWPKFALSTLMRAEDGIAVTAIAPCQVKTTVDGVGVTLTVETGYPFEDGYRVHVETEKPVEFSVYLRIPGFFDAALAEGESVPVGKPFKVRRVFSDDTLTVSFKASPRFVSRPSGLVCVKRGALTYALAIEEEWKKLEYTRSGVERKFPFCDYEIYPKSKWNYGFASQDLTFEQGTLGSCPFSPEGAPVQIKVKLAELDWKSEYGICAEKPESLSPISAACEGMLIPYGCTNLRMTEMPLLFID